MIHIFIPIGISLMVFALSERFKIIRLVSGAIFTFLIIILFLFLYRKDDIVLNIPFISIDDTEYNKIEKNGVMILETGYSATLKNEYVLSGDFDEKYVAEWVSDSTRPIYAYIKYKDEIQWSYNFGAVTDSTVERIKDVYETWISDGLVPKDEIRYKFLCFYFDVT